MTLFLERGYDAVTVAEIAERAGLTKRSFFNHFPDKREVLFAEAAALETEVVHYIDETPPRVSAIDAALGALTATGAGLAEYMEYAGARRALVASSVDLLERDLVKTASLIAAVAHALEARGAPPRAAHFTAHASVTTFMTAFDDWILDPGAPFATLMDRARHDLREAVVDRRSAGEPAEQESVTA
jgi:AcrR family transcriptional regulator